MGKLLFQHNQAAPSESGVVFSVDCDYCDEEITDVRIICLMCQSTNTFDTVEFHGAPKDCLDYRITRDDLAKPHLPTHDLLKVRRVVHQRQFGNMSREAMAALQTARELLGGKAQTKPSEEEDDEDEDEDNDENEEHAHDEAIHKDAAEGATSTKEPLADASGNLLLAPTVDPGIEISVKAASVAAASSVMARTTRTARTVRSVVSRAPGDTAVTKQTCAACGKDAVQPVWYCVHCQGQYFQHHTI